MEKIQVKEGIIEDVLPIHEQILEFDEMEVKKEVFEARYQNTNHIILIAYQDNVAIGYLIAYEASEKNILYCWLAGVKKEYRNKGALTQMMAYLEKWMKDQNYQKLTIKTRNDKRQMLKFLVNRNFDIVKVEVMQNQKQNRIYLEKEVI